MKLFKTFLFLLTIISLVVFNGCKEDDTVDPIKVLSIVASGNDLQTGSPIDVDLNGTASASGVPLDAVIKVTFDMTLDATSVSSSTVTLERGGTVTGTAITASGSSISIIPNDELERGLDYVLTLTSGIKSADGGALTSTTRTFTAAGRAGVVPPNDANQKGYWQLDGNANAAVGGLTGTETGMTYGMDRLGNMESAAVFDGDVSIIEIANASDLITKNWTLSYWMKVDSNDHKNADGFNAGHFVMGLGDVYGFFIEIQGGLGGMKLTGRYERSGGTTVANDFFFNGDGKDGMNGGWVAVEFEKDLGPTGGLGTIIDNKWTHVLITYDAAINSRSLYLNGDLMETDNLNLTTGLNDLVGMTFDDSDAGTDVIGKALAFGFNHDIETTHWDTEPWGGYDFTTSNHFKGMLDDVRIFDASFSAADAKALYDAEK